MAKMPKTMVRGERLALCQKDTIDTRSLITIQAGMKYLIFALLLIVGNRGFCEKRTIPIISLPQHRANVIAAAKRAVAIGSRLTKPQLDLLYELTLTPLPLYNVDGTPIEKEGPMAQDQRQAIAILSRDYAIRFGMTCPQGGHCLKGPQETADLFSHFYDDHRFTEITLLNHKTHSGINLLQSIEGLEVSYTPHKSGYHANKLHVEWKGFDSAEEFFELFHLITHASADKKQTAYERALIRQARHSLPYETLTPPITMVNAEGEVTDSFDRWEKKLTPVREEAKLLLLSQEFADRTRADELIVQLKEYGFDFSPWLKASESLGDLEMDGYYDSLYGNLAMDTDLTGPGYNSQVFALGGLHGRGLHGGPWGL